MISVCLATYNGAQFIEEQVHSVLAQLSKTDELIIADDGSTDDTVSKILALNDSRVSLLKSDGNIGIIKNFERVLLAAKGEHIFLCDQDDVWLPGKVNACVEVLKNSLLVVTDCKVVNAELEILSNSFFQTRNSGVGLLKNITRNSYLGCCMAFNKSLLKFAMPMPRNLPMHDMWLGLIAETQGRVTFLPQQLLLYRRHGTNASPTAGKSHYSLLKKLSYRITLSYLLLSRVIFNQFKQFQ